MKNPLLVKKFQHRLGAIPFDKFKTEHFMPAIEKALDLAKKTFKKVRSNPDPATFENTMLALEHGSELLERVSGIYFNLLSAESDTEFKALAQQISPMLAEFGSKVMTDEALFNRVKQIYDNEVKGKKAPTLPKNLTKRETLVKAERYRLIKREYDSFIRNGALLKNNDKIKLTEINMELAKLSPKFADNLLNATNAFELHLTSAKEVKGIPESTLSAAAYYAKQKGKDGGWLFSLQPSSFMPLLTYCENRKARETVQTAYAARAFKDQFDNQEIIKQIVNLRTQRAKLLGYDTHAEYVLKDRMAESVITAFDFLNRIYDIAYPAALNEIDEVAAFARKLDNIDKLMPWDYPYYANKLKQEKYDFDPEMLRPWFKVEEVIEGLFVIANKIYDISLKEVTDVPVYHKDIRTWEVYDNKGLYLGLLYLDLFPRETKRGGAWMTTYQKQGMYSDELRRPFVAIVSSFTPSTPDQPSLLRIDEVRTLFHEFGHALHGLLSDCYFKSLASPSVLWDFVELPSQIMENWLMEKDALAFVAKHYQTGEPLPEDYLNKLLAAKNFHAGIANINQLRYGMLDFAWHTFTSPFDEEVNEFEKKIVERYRLMPSLPDTNISCAFAHIFAGGYSAGYYSYKWAEALEADAWSLFLEKGIFDKDVADSFRKNILARGNSFHPMDLFIAFRGRKPDTDAVLRRDGLIS